MCFRVTLSSPKDNFNFTVTEIIRIISCFASVQSFTLCDEQQINQSKENKWSLFFAFNYFASN